MYSIKRNGENITLTEKEVEFLVSQKRFNDFKEEFKLRVPDFSEELFEMYLFEISTKDFNALNAFAETHDIPIVQKNIEDIDFNLLAEDN